MRSKARSKTVKKTRSRTKTRTVSRKRSVSKKPLNTPSVSEGSLTSPGTVYAIVVKKCEELEVGDIGNFGSPGELEDHEKRCSEPATQFCHTCGRNLCGNHYELLHRDHDVTAGKVVGTALS